MIQALGEERPVVLVVEDEFMIREYAVDMINEAVFEGIEAANADEAIEILESRSDIQMVFTDIHMPGSIDGLKLAHSARDWVRPKARTQNQPHKPVMSPLRRRMGRNLIHGRCWMTRIVPTLVAALFSVLATNAARAECQIADAKLEEAILNKPQLRGVKNRQAVRDLRSLRDAALTLQSYGRHDDCERMLATIRELIAGPIMSSLGDNDEDSAEKQNAAREPKVHRGAEQGSRGQKGAKPLVRIDQLAPALRADEIIGAEVRSSDDKIVGEVRNIVFGTKDGRDYAIVASGGFFTTGKSSIVVPIQSLQVSQERASFFLPISKEAVGGVPLMPDQDYKWLSDRGWRSKNDAIFVRR